MKVVATDEVVPLALVDLVGSGDPTMREIGAAIRTCLVDDLDYEERAWCTVIEDLRERLESSDDEISVALLSRRSSDKVAALGEVTRQRSKKPPWSQLLMVLARRLRPERVLEMGTGVGISACHMAAALRMNGTGSLLTLEGAPALAAVARSNLEELGLRRAEVVTGMFKDVLEPTLERIAPVDLAFIDGHHDEQATKAYFETLLPSLANPSVVVFDDITWSDGMTRAWQVLRAHPSVRCSVDLQQLGICVIGAGDGPVVVVDLPPLKRGARPSRRQPSASIDAVKGLCWGSRKRAPAGWIVVDADADDDADDAHLVGNVVDGLPLADDSVPCAVSVHTLQDLALADLIPALAELRRVLQPGGVLRVCVPDLERLIEWWQRGEHDRFVVPDHQAATPSGKLIVHALWYGAHRSLFTAEFLEELLVAAGFSHTMRCEAGRTASAHNEIVVHDDRNASSLVVEAVK